MARIKDFILGPLTNSAFLMQIGLVAFYGVFRHFAEPSGVTHELTVVLMVACGMSVVTRMTEQPLCNIIWLATIAVVGAMVALRESVGVPVGPHGDQLIVFTAWAATALAVSTRLVFGRRAPWAANDSLSGVSR